MTAPATPATAPAMWDNASASLVTRTDPRTDSPTTLSQHPERDRVIVRLYRDERLTLDEVGAAVGISGERVRQILMREGVPMRRGSPSRRKTRPEVMERDRVFIRYALKDVRVDTLKALAWKMGFPATTITQRVRRVGLHPAVMRLFRARRARSRLRLEVEALEALAALAAELGHTPGIRDINRADRHAVPSHMTYVKLFGSVCEAQRAAGLTPNRPGGRYDKITIERTTERTIERTTKGRNAR